MPIDRVELRSVTCPPATLQAAPLVQDISFPLGAVRELEIIVPAGHAFITGIAIMQSQQIVIPYTGSVWVISDDESIKWPYDDRLKNGSWQVSCFNLDPTYAHTWYLRFLVDSRASQPSRTIARPIDPRSIEQAALILQEA